MSQLKPCPFCGGRAELYQHTTRLRGRDEPVRGQWSVVCPTIALACPMTVTTHTLSKRLAVKAWNRRSP